ALAFEIRGCPRPATVARAINCRAARPRHVEEPLSHFSKVADPRAALDGSAIKTHPITEEDVMRLKHLDLMHAILLAGFAVLSVPASSQAAANLDEARLKAADTEPQNWFTLGRDGNQTNFSPLSTIDAATVDRLGFAWSYDMATARGQEATPIVVDGVMYTSG